MRSRNAVYFGMAMLFACLTGQTQVLGQTAELYLRTGQEPAAACVSPAGTVSIEFRLDNVTEAVNGVQTILTYDASVMTLNPASSTEASGWFRIVLSTSPGTATYAAYRQGDSVGPLVDDSQLIATFVFDVNNVGATNVNMDATETKLTPIDHDPLVISGASLTRFDSGVVNSDGASASNNGPVCEGSLLTLSGSTPGAGPNTPYTYEWSGPDSFTSFDQNPTVSTSATAAMAGLYTLTVTNGDGCVHQATTTVVVNEAPVASAGSDVTVCVDETALVLGGSPTASGGTSPYTILWTGAGAAFLDDTSAANPTFDASAAGLGAHALCVDVTDASGCVATQSCITVTVTTAPVASAGSDVTVCVDETALVLGGSPTASGGTSPYTILWTGAGAAFLDDTSAANPTFDASAAGLGAHALCVDVTDASGCVATQSCITVTVGSCVDLDLIVEGLAGNPGLPGGPYGSPGGPTLTRNVEFVLTDCELPAETQTIVLPVTFSPSGVNGAASVRLTGVPAGLDSVSVREGHTLRTLTSVNLISGLGFASMTLRTGDIQTATVAQDGLVDIVDFSILSSRWNQIIPADSSLGADVNGDGLQATADFQAMQFNFFELSDPINACGGRGDGSNPPDDVDVLVGNEGAPEDVAPLAPVKNFGRSPKSAITVTELMAIAPSAVSADFNGDGVVDVKDIRRFATQNGLTLNPRFESKLRQIEQARTLNEAAISPRK